MKNVRVRSTGELEKLIFFKTPENEHNEIKVRAFFDAKVDAEKIKKIADVIEKAAQEIVKIVEEI